MKPITILALATSMGRDEIIGLKRERIDLERRMIMVTKTRNKRVKHVPLNADAPDALQKQLQSREEGGIYVFPNRKGEKMGSTKTAWYQAIKRAGLPVRCGFHDLRHTSISRMIMAGVSSAMLTCPAITCMREQRHWNGPIICTI